MEHLETMGVDPLVMVYGLKTPPDDIYLLLPEQLKKFKLATKLMDG